MDRTALKRLSKRPVQAEPSYEVGYGKPPVATRFKPGESGNPSGRPRGRKKTVDTPAMGEERLKRVVLEEAYRTIAVRDGDRMLDIPVIQAVMRSVALNAAKGHQRSQRMFTDLLQWVEGENKDLHDEWLETAIQYKLDWELELERRERTGDSGPEPIPHPDHVYIDPRKGTAEIRGPMTPDEQKDRDHLIELKRGWDEDLADVEERLRSKPDDPSLQKELKTIKRVQSLAKQVLETRYWFREER